MIFVMNEIPHENMIIIIIVELYFRIIAESHILFEDQRCAESLMIIIRKRNKVVIKI